VKTNGDDDDESTAGTRPVSRVGKELAKRLASNFARRRMSLLASESEAKERLQQPTVDDEVVETHDRHYPMRIDDHRHD
jgi:hypothetical protein